MKGLLLKDWYMMKAYCRIYPAILAIFLAISLFGEEELFFAFYPCMLCGMLPVNLIAYDEQSRWAQYSGTLPCTRAQLVSSKYLICLFTQGAVLLLSGLAHGIRMVLRGGFDGGEFASFLLALLAVAVFTSSVPLPFIFKLGVEKGRVAYYLMIGVVCALSAAAGDVLAGGLSSVLGGVGLVVLAVAAVAVYLLSWRLSITFYQARETV